MVDRIIRRYNATDSKTGQSPGGLTQQRKPAGSRGTQAAESKNWLIDSGRRTCPSYQGRARLFLPKKRDGSRRRSKTVAAEVGADTKPAQRTGEKEAPPV